MTLEVEVYPDEEWADQTAAHLAQLIGGRDCPRLCLPTGETVTPLYRQVGQLADLGETTVFLLDEFGGLPTDSTARCSSMIKRDLLDRLEIEPLVHTPDVDAPDPDAEARRYDQLVREGGLHLCLLGLGANGHVGMNEPGSTRDSETRVVRLDDSTAGHAVEAYGGETKPTWGITLGLKTILQSDRIWLLVTGEHKSEILSRTVTEPIGPDTPATFLREHPRATIHADESAAALL